MFDGVDIVRGCLLLMLGVVGVRCWCLLLLRCEAVVVAVAMCCRWYCVLLVAVCRG